MNEEDFKLIVEDYLETRNFLSARIPEAKKAKRPDFGISRPPRALTYLGELKAPELHLNPNTGMYMHLTKIRKIREHTQKGVEQFEAFDPGHTRPRIMFFTSTHFQFSGIDLMHALRGFIASNGRMHNDFRKDSIVVATVPYISRVDLFIWLQVSPNGYAYQVTHINNPSSKFYAEAYSLTEELRKMPVSSNMDQNFLLN